MWSSYFTEMGGDPLDDFAPLRGLIKARYTIVDAKGPYVALVRNDLLPEQPRVLTELDSLPRRDESGALPTARPLSDARTRLDSTAVAAPSECATR